MLAAAEEMRRLGCPVGPSDRDLRQELGPTLWVRRTCGHVSDNEHGVQMRTTDRLSESEIAAYEASRARRAAQRRQLFVTIAIGLKRAIGFAVVAGLGFVLDLALASAATADGQDGRALSAKDLTSGAALAGVMAYAALVVCTWAIWHHPKVQKRRALRRAARERLAARIGPEHPLRQFSALHPYLSFLLRTWLVFELFQVVFGRVTPRRRL